MGVLPTVDRIQARLDAATAKWWLYLILALLFFIPTYAARGYGPRESVDLIQQVLADPLISSLPALMPIAKAVPVALVAGLFVLGNRMRRAFDAYVALLFVALGLFQTVAVTDSHGLVVLSGNMALVLIVALAWIWEVVAQRNDFAVRTRALWRWWVAPPAILAILAPIDAGPMTPDFDPVGMLTNSAALTFCMMTPFVLAVLTLFHPTLNRTVLRITSFVGILFGLVNMVTWFALEPWGWWMGILHMPLVGISAYAFVLAHTRKGPAQASNQSSQAGGEGDVGS
jgi:hypothetical protein